MNRTVPKFRRLLSASLAAALAASTLALWTEPAHAAPRTHLAGQHEPRIPGAGGQPLKTKAWPVNRPPSKPWPAPVWPSAVSGQADLTATSGAVRVPGSPVSVKAVPGKGHAAKVAVQVLGRDTVPAGWRSGVVARLQRVDGDPAAGAATVSIDYSGFRHAYGGDWASRLRLWQVPDCALAVGVPAGCSATPLKSVNDTAAGTVTADVRVAAVSGTLVALTSGASGSSGDFAASGLAASATWSAGGSSGDFAWNYPMTVPPALGGPQPSIGISYSSASVDGRSSATNNQPSWVGEGFELNPGGYIERRYVPCSEDMTGTHNNSTATGDECWRSDNATLSLNGSGGEMIHDDTTGWHARSENGYKIEKLPGAVNGDVNGEYWKVTTTEGTQYFFGLNNLPGQSSATNSVNTVPVYSNNPGEPNYATGDFAGSKRVRAWRWNLDYVVDVHGNTMSYWYTKYTNNYAARASDTTVDSYVRDSVLNRIDYGTFYRLTTDGFPLQQISTAPVGQVVFDTANRCLTTCSDNANWPDTPIDQECTSSSSCPGKYSPTFWSKLRLTTVTTKVFTTPTTPVPVQSWTLAQSFPGSGDADVHGGLWLDSITQAGLVGTTSTMPPTTFTPISMENRVVTKAQSSNNWFRLAEIINETGAKVQVYYSAKECSASNLPADEWTNTKMCYPVLSQDPNDSSKTVKEWWHKYVVTDVAESDLVQPGAPPTKEVHYQYVGTPAWHYADDDGLSKPKYKTWSQFRGYAQVNTREGAGGSPQTLTETFYLRGMHGDRVNLNGGTKTVTVPASIGSETVYDYDQYAGMTREVRTFDGDETKPISKSVNVPWRSSAKASRTVNGDVAEARYTNTAATYASTALGVYGSRGWRTARTVTTFDDTYGSAVTSQDDGAWASDPNDHSLDGDEKCITYSYNRNPAKNLLATIKQTTTIALPCGTAPSTQDDVISDIRNYYDGAASVDTPPVFTNITKFEQLKDWAPGTGTVWDTAATQTYDDFGRTLVKTDLLGVKTTTAYTPSAAGPVTKIATTGPMTGWTRTDDILPYWGSVAKSTDINGRVVEVTYDPFGRVNKVWKIGWAKTGHENQPSAEYTYVYAPNRDAYPYVLTKTINATGNYNLSYDISDALLRHRQTQTQAVGTGWIVASTFYDSLGRITTTHDGYWADESQHALVPGTVWNGQSEGTLPRVTRTVYDATSRPVLTTFLSRQQVNGVWDLYEQWHSSTSYEGDLTKVTPAAGGVATTTRTDIAGRTVELRQHTTTQGVNGAYQSTSYAYNKKNQLIKITDPAGDEWRTEYDIRGNVTKTVDPDKGTTLSTYNDDNQLTSTTDANNEVLAYKYDSIGRKIAVYDDNITTGTLRSEWKYDTLYTGTPIKGQLTQTIRYDAGLAYKWQASGFTLRYQPSGANYVIPVGAQNSGLSGAYQYSYSYSQFDGTPTAVTYPSGGNLSGEQVTTTYTAQGLPATLKGNLSEGTYVARQDYTEFGEPSVTSRQTDAGSYVDSAYTYEDATRRVHSTMIKPQILNLKVDERTYSYDAAGNIQSIADVPESGSIDRQCFSYNNLAQLTEAWTLPTATTTCGTPAVTTQGPAPYWHSYTYDSIGNRTTQTSHASDGNTVQTLTLPTPGANVVRPHAATSVKTDLPDGRSITSAYTFDNAGNTKGRNGPTGGAQVLTWDSEGRQVQIATDGATTTTDLYDADGARLIHRDNATGTTLYLPGMELHREPIGTVTGTRYYTFGDDVVASRTPSKLTWLFPDHQGTQQVSIDALTQAVSVRRQTPYGEPRGSQPAWPNAKGFVGGDIDATGLTHIGARYYDTALGRFISVDPLLDTNDPAQFNAYQYGANNPITSSDPTGMRVARDESGSRTPTAPPPAPKPQPKPCDTWCKMKSAGKGLLKGWSEVNSEPVLGLWNMAVGLYDYGKANYEAASNGDISWFDAAGNMWKATNVDLPLAAGKGMIDTVTGIYTEGKASYDAAKAGDWEGATYHATKSANDLVMTAMTLVDGAGALKAASAAAKTARAGEGLEGLADFGKSLRGEACNSFTGGTLVMLAGGLTKPIEKLQLGDVVLATDPVSGQTKPEAVTTTIVGHGWKHLVDIVVDTDGDRGDAFGVVTATYNHPFWAADRNVWVQAIDLRPGDMLRTPDGGLAEVLDSADGWVRTTVYNLTVANLHTYFVSAAGVFVLAHNAGGEVIPNWVKDEVAKIRAGQGTPNPQLNSPDQEIWTGTHSGTPDAYKRKWGAQPAVPDKFPAFDGSPEWQIPGKPASHKIIGPNRYDEFGYTTNHYGKITPTGC